MNTRKWNPFKFLRGAGRRSDAQRPEGQSESEQWNTSWPDISRFLSREPWRAVEEFILDPF
ncbi:Hsp20/alpha crystallin family protein, partial [Paraburkholderia sp. UYCP14C]